MGNPAQNIVNAVAAFLDDLADLVEAVVRGVVRFERTTRDQSG